MNVSEKSLLLFQLGPVQKFIAQAETIGDLRAGSELLSQLTAAAIRSVPDFEINLVFPSAVGNEDLKGIPNRFLAYVPRDGAAEVAKEAEAAARNALRKISEGARKLLSNDPSKEAAFDAQVSEFLQITWAILADSSGDMGADYAAIGKQMACRRNTREFNAWPEDGGSTKDFLSGCEAALEKGRGAMNLIKRCLADQNPTKISLKEGYIAVIAMDGDQMGIRLSKNKKAEDHRAFSEHLVAFNKSVQNFFKDRMGELLIYAGGDDVLAIVRAEGCIETANMLRDIFKREFVDKVPKAFDDQGKPLEGTASAGVAIGHVSVPLQDLIHAAHAAESRAKGEYGRNALAVSVFKRSGEILEWGCNWTLKGTDAQHPALKIYNALHAHKEIGGRFAYKLAGFLEPYGLRSLTLTDENKMRDVIVQETDHVIEQTEGMGAIFKGTMLEEYLDVIPNRPEDYLNLFLVETFINRQGKEDR